MIIVVPPASLTTLVSNLLSLGALKKLGVATSTDINYSAELLLQARELHWEGWDDAGLILVSPPALSRPLARHRVWYTWTLVNRRMNR